MKKNNKYYKELRSKNKEEKNNQNTEVDADKEVIAGRKNCRFYHAVLFI